MNKDTNRTERQNNQIMPFTYGDRAVRAVQINEAPWFIVKDVCEILEIQNPSKAIENFPNDERFALTGSEAKVLGFDHATSGVNLINEPGLYRLVFQSRKPEAERFKTWVFNEVLPQIRQTGAYVPPSIALMDRIFKVFVNEEDMGLQRIFKLLDLALAKSDFTGEYVKAIDVAAAVMRGIKQRPTYGQLGALATKVSEVRRIVEESDTPLPRYRFAGSVYKEALPCSRPGFPLELPAPEVNDVRA
jgi:prophage antirepressor-like protein